MCNILKFTQNSTYSILAYLFTAKLCDDIITSFTTLLQKLHHWKHSSGRSIAHALKRSAVDQLVLSRYDQP